jgi:hypothetical protein
MRETAITGRHASTRTGNHVEEYSALTKYTLKFNINHVTLIAVGTTIIGREAHAAQSGELRSGRFFY